MTNFQPDKLLDSVAYWLMEHIKPLKKLEPLYNKHRQFLLYGALGAGTVFISLFTYGILTEVFKWNILVSNAIAWFLATGFSFYTTRKWVFKGHTRGTYALILQFTGFYLGRALTLFFEEWGLFFFVEVMKWPNMLVKLVLSVVVIALNYIFSKLVVFRKKAA